MREAQSKDLRFINSANSLPLFSAQFAPYNNYRSIQTAGAGLLTK